MILCVTLNPCLDKTLTVPSWQRGESVRGTGLCEVVGGKGNNVARALKALGHRDVRPVTFLGGSVGSQCEHLLRSSDRFDPIVIATSVPTRVILTVRTELGTDQTAFFDPDPAITKAEAYAMVARVAQSLDAGEVEAITLSGSSPDASTHGLYSELIILASERQVPVFLDTYGPSLRSIWGSWPQVMQLNRSEAGMYLGVKMPEDSDIIGLLLAWARQGVILGVVTNGADAVFAIHDGKIYQATPPVIDLVNPIGSGDCLLAGLVDGWLHGFASAEALLMRGIACASANAAVWDAGAISPATVASLESQVKIEP